MSDDSATFRRRRDAVAARVGGPVLLVGNGAMVRNGRDVTYPFRQDSHFWYFTGLDVPDAAVVVDGGVHVLLVDPPGDQSVVWVGEQRGVDELARRAGADRVAPLDAVADLVDWRAVHYLVPSSQAGLVRLCAWRDASPSQVADGASAALAAAVAALRVRKDPEEIAAIEAAAAVDRELYDLVARRARPGVAELHVVADMEHHLHQRGYTWSFAPIVTVRGEVLHQERHDGVMAAGDLLLADIGVEKTGCPYASDHTRTLAVDGRFSPRQAAVYDAVLRAWHRAVDAVAPGVPFAAVHRAAALEVAAALREWGVVTTDAESAVRAGAHQVVFPHGVGHLLGLDVHDLADLGPAVNGDAPRPDEPGMENLRLWRTLEPGMVVTVEPGIYFNAAWIRRCRETGRWKDVVHYDALAPFAGLGGVRIEDDVLVTETGCRVLGPPIPRERDEVARWVRG